MQGPRLLYTREKGREPILHKAGRAPGSVWMTVEYIAPTGIRSPDSPNGSKLLY